MAEAVYKFGQRRYTLRQIRESGFRHGRDGIQYHPPRRWGRDDGEPDFPAADECQRAYAEGYEAGQQ